jgi:hypothetical protein
MLSYLPVVGVLSRCLVAPVGRAPPAKAPPTIQLTSTQQLLFQRLAEKRPENLPWHFRHDANIQMWIQHWGGMLKSDDAVLQKWEDALAWREQHGVNRLVSDDGVP